MMIVNAGIEFVPVCFNSVRKSVKNHRLNLQKTFQEIVSMIDVSISDGFGWNVELIESQYIHISTYRPLRRSFCIKLPVELRSPKKRSNQSQKERPKMFFLVSC